MSVSKENKQKLDFDLARMSRKSINLLLQVKSYLLVMIMELVFHFPCVMCVCVCASQAICVWTRLNLGPFKSGHFWKSEDFLASAFLPSYLCLRHKNCFLFCFSHVLLSASMSPLLFSGRRVMN